MDPLAPLVAALLAGAAAGLKTTVADAVKDGYGALKRILGERYKTVDLATIERDPQKTDARQTLQEQLRNSGAATDPELMSSAKALLDEVSRAEPDLADVIGVDLEGIKAGRVRIDDIVSARSGVRVKDAVARGDFEISRVRAGGVGEMLGKPKRR